MAANATASAPTDKSIITCGAFATRVSDHIAESEARPATAPKALGVCPQGVSVHMRRWDQKVPTGKVKWFNATKGYVFIHPDGGDRDVLVHISEVEGGGITSLVEGAKVTYEIKTFTGARNILRTCE
jgi:cold shock protein